MLIDLPDAGVDGGAEAIVLFKVGGVDSGARWFSRAWRLQVIPLIPVTSALRCLVICRLPSSNAHDALFHAVV